MQHLRGAFADDRRGIMRSVDLATLPTSTPKAPKRAAIAGAESPHSVISAHQMLIARLRRPITYVELHLGTVTFRILDKAHP